VLKGPWETGDSAGVIAAMAEFRRLYQKDLMDHSPVAHTDQAEFRAWSKRFAQWLFSTGHISIRYGIDYDGVDIRKLSPGTRGIVLLLLYLALDDSDNRPLVIDQPEENLDPKSVFDELVHLFIEAKSHRQVIMVTHNANLVINTRTKSSSQSPDHIPMDRCPRSPTARGDWRAQKSGRLFAIFSRAAKARSKSGRGACVCGSKNDLPDDCCSHSPPDAPPGILPTAPSILTPDRFISRASPAQFGSTRRRWPDGTPACGNSRPSKISSV
jgi:hypothetical protein